MVEEKVEILGVEGGKAKGGVHPLTLAGPRSFCKGA